MDSRAAIRLGADEAWAAAWAELGFVSHPGLREQVAAAYAEPTRAYHGRRHLDECFAHLAAVADRLDRPAEVVLALWFHDAVYDPRRPDNEARSAEWAADSLRGGVPRAPRSRRPRQPRPLAPTAGRSGPRRDLIGWLDCVGFVSSRDGCGGA